MFCSTSTERDLVGISYISLLCCTEPMGAYKKLKHQQQKASRGLVRQPLV